MKKPYNEIMEKQTYFVLDTDVYSAAMNTYMFLINTAEAMRPEFVVVVFLVLGRAHPKIKMKKVLLLQFCLLFPLTLYF